MDNLKQAIASRQVILFVGAGVSMNLGLPSWEDLMRKMGEDLGFPPDEFIRLGNYLALAEYYRVRKGGLGDLVRWMDATWHAGGEALGDSAVHRLIVELDFPMIYTTNYDRWLERAFDHYQRPYVKIVSVHDLLQLHPGVTQIVKYHGDFDDETSLTVNETSFFDRLEFESPLDIKLRADCLARSVLFIGYSLSDINLRLLFYRLSQLWRRYGTGEPPCSYLFSPRGNPVQKTVLAQWGITMVSPDKENAQDALIDFLSSLRLG
ncbi:MAG: SIR2 family protein [Desulfuromonadales bacterium]|nr:SIR2 family protein [Desulfuromonadales bacterium]